MGIADHPTCFLTNLYVSQKATVRTGHGTTDQFKTSKRVGQGSILHPVYLIYMQSISWEMPFWMNHSWNQDFWGIINNFRYAADDTVIAESKEPLDEGEEESKCWPGTQYSKN